MDSEMSCMERVKFASSKLMVEFFGTFVLTLVFITNNGYAIVFAYWILSIFVWKISSAQFNPAITLAFMFRTDGKRIHPVLGMLMMAAQCAGAYLAAFYMWFMLLNASAVMGPSASGNAWNCICQEIIGTFVFVLLYKIVTDERLHFSKENTINMFVIAAIYQTSRQIVNGATNSVSTFGAVLNPAIAVGVTLFSMFKEPGDTFKYFWIYWFLPLGGSFLALLFYRFVYVKTQNMVLSDNSPADDDQIEYDDVDILKPRDGPTAEDSLVVEA